MKYRSFFTYNIVLWQHIIALYVQVQDSPYIFCNSVNKISISGKKVCLSWFLIVSPRFGNSEYTTDIHFTI